jgi:DNA-binding NarL/FixJ family response regulator
VSIRVLMVEDPRMVREALCEMLTLAPDIEIVGQAGNALEALEQAAALAPDVVVLDGIEVALSLSKAGSRAKLVALSSSSDHRSVSAMVRSGVSAYVTKSAAGNELIRAIRAVAANEVYFSSEIAAALASEVRGRPEAHEPAPLARREREVLRLIAEGMRSAAIAETLHVTVGTVEVHRRNIKRKLGMHSVVELTKHAIREGIVSL